MRKLRDILANEGGAIAAVFGIAAPVIVGGATFAVDAASLMSKRAQLQSIADSSALAGARQLLVYGSDADRLAETTRERAEALLREQNLADAAAPPAIIVDEDAGTVRVSLVADPRTMLLENFGYAASLAASAQARAFGSARICVLALDQADAAAISGQRLATLDAPACAVQSNSTHVDSIDMQDASRVVASAICSGGGVRGSGDAFSPEPQTDCPALEDPLRTVEPPAIGGCDHTNKTILLGLHTLSPGHYCGGLNILPGALVFAEPGEYVFSGGPLTLGLASALRGEHVSFRFTDADSTFSFGLGSIVELSAPVAGPMAGFLFYQDRSVPRGEVFRIATDLATKLLGTIYLPNGTLDVDVLGIVAGKSAYTVIVADRIDIKGADLVINSDYGATDIPVPAGVGPSGGQIALER